MNKEAFDNVRDLTPTELFLMSGAAGAGTFGTLRLISEMMKRTNGNGSMPRPKTIPLMLKNPAEQGQSNPALDNSVPSPVGVDKLSSIQDQDWLPQTIAVLGGVPAGFLGAKTLYDKYQQNQNAQKIEAAKQQYLQQLQAAQATQTKIATPLVDKFCEGIAETISKQANDFQLSPDQLSGEPLVQDAIRNQYDQHLRTNIGRGVDAVSGNSWHNAKNALALLAGATGIGTLGYLINSNKIRREKEQKSQYPVGVSYAQ